MLQFGDLVYFYEPCLIDSTSLLITLEGDSLHDVFSNSPVRSMLRWIWTILSAVSFSQIYVGIYASVISGLEFAEDIHPAVCAVAALKRLSVPSPTLPQHFCSEFTKSSKQNLPAYLPLPKPNICVHVLSYTCLAVCKRQIPSLRGCFIKSDDDRRLIRNNVNSSMAVGMQPQSWVCKPLCKCCNREAKESGPGGGGGKGIFIWKVESECGIFPGFNPASMVELNRGTGDMEAFTSWTWGFLLMDWKCRKWETKCIVQRSY